MSLRRPVCSVFSSFKVCRRYRTDPSRSRLDVCLCLASVRVWRFRASPAATRVPCDSVFGLVCLAVLRARAPECPCRVNRVFKKHTWKSDHELRKTLCREYVEQPGLASKSLLPRQLGGPRPATTLGTRRGEGSAELSRMSRHRHHSSSITTICRHTSPEIIVDHHSESCLFTHHPSSSVIHHHQCERMLEARENRKNLPGVHDLPSECRARRLQQTWHACAKWRNSGCPDTSEYVEEIIDRLTEEEFDTFLPNEEALQSFIVWATHQWPQIQWATSLRSL